MGLAASQARFLQLTARKSNIEFQGQQINQQRLILANESAGLFQRQLVLEPPVPPSSNDEKYVTPAYQFYDAAADKTKTIKFIFDINHNVIGAVVTYDLYTSTGVSTTRTINVHTGLATGASDPQSHGVPTSFANDVAFDPSSGRLDKLNLSIWDDVTGTAITTNYTGDDLTYNPITDTKLYDDDMNKYEYSKSVYDGNLDKINSQTASIQNQDRSLELKMRQLDTEHSAVMTEMESVQKVIKTNLESSFKTFAA